MRKSARVLGQDYGLTAQEMNFVLREEGFLDGEPGDYIVTEKGENYAEEQNHSRGVGGYSFYNRAWTTRTWDDSIADNLDITDDRKKEIREAIRIAKQKAHEVEDGGLETERDIHNNEDTSTTVVNEALVKAVGALLIVASAYGIYKATPYIKAWWHDKAFPSLEKWHDKVASSLKRMKNKINGKEEEAEN